MSKLLLDSRPMVIIPELACSIGLNEAIILQQVHYWVEINRKANKNKRNGFYWTYNTIKDWSEQFNWWSEATVKRIFSSLEKQGLLVSGAFNKAGWDRTKWYRINYDHLALSYPLDQNDLMDKINVTNTIPEISKKTIKVVKAQISKEEEIVRSTTVQKENVFKRLEEQYEANRIGEMLDTVDWYIDDAYFLATGQSHPNESKAKRMIFVEKLLNASSELFLEADEGDLFIVDALERAINHYRGDTNPTIYYVTTPQVLGYWLIQDDNIGYETVNGTIYAPVEEYY